MEDKILLPIVDSQTPPIHFDVFISYILTDGAMRFALLDANSILTAQRATKPITMQNGDEVFPDMIRPIAVVDFPRSTLSDLLITVLDLISRYGERNIEIPQLSKPNASKEKEQLRKQFNDFLDTVCPQEVE
jgi:hypothetical protein